MSIRIKLMTVVAGLTVLSSCGGDGGDLTDASGSVDQAMMVSLLASGATMFTDSMGSFKFDGGGQVSLPFSNLDASIGQKNVQQTAAGGGSFDSCTTKSGNKTDADNDGIAVSYRQDFNCNGVSDGGALVSQVGFYSEKDLDDAKFGMRGGFEYEFEIRNVYEVAHETNTGAWRGLWSLRRTGSTYETESKYTAVSSNVPTDPTNGLADFEWQSTWKTVHTPEDMDSPWLKGKFKNDGFFRVTGKYTDNQKRLHEINVVFRVETKDLVYDRNACGGGFFKDGSYSYFDASGNEFKFSYTNCTEKKTFNGQDI